MQPLNVDLRPRSWPILLLLTAMAMTLAGAVVHAGAIMHAAPPIEEIRTIMLQRALWPPSSKSLAALDTENLQAGLRAIDSYARYVPPSSLLGYSSPSPSLGIDIISYKSRPWVQADPGGPADKAGIPEIGKLQAINGTKVFDVDFSKVLALFDLAVRHGRVSLTLSSRSDGKRKTFKVQPVKFQSSSLMWRRIGDNVIVRIREFIAHDTAPGIAALYNTLVRSNSQVVIDLRGCSGGDLYEAIEIAGMFVAAGLPLASTYDRSGMIQTYRAPPGHKLASSTWLLIDRRTASAAEIFAGILQYYHLAHLVGEQSAGKCVSQTPVPLSDGGKLWLTTLAIYFPNGMSCNGTGLEPDIPYHDITVTKSIDIIAELDSRTRVPQKK